MNLTLPHIPADVPQEMRATFANNYDAITHKSGRLMLFAGDQKIEHLNKDLSGPNTAAEAQDPEHLFKIAGKGRIGVFATHLGMITQYGSSYPHVPYLAKLNGKTDIIPAQERDPVSTALWSVEDVVRVKKAANLNICAVGYTVYLGSEYEHLMLKEAAQIVHQAHTHGLVAVLWMYPRGKHVANEKDHELIAGAAGVATSLGADFAKINVPAPTEKSSAQLLERAVRAAGTTKIICSGGQQKNPEQFLQELYDQLHTAGTAGNATGRNIYQHPLTQAIAMTRAISALVIDDADLATAQAFLQRN